MVTFRPAPFLCHLFPPLPPFSTACFTARPRRAYSRFLPFRKRTRKADPHQSHCNPFPPIQSNVYCVPTPRAGRPFSQTSPLPSVAPFYMEISALHTPTWHLDLSFPFLLIQRLVRSPYHASTMFPGHPPLFPLIEYQRQFRLTLPRNPGFEPPPRFSTGLTFPPFPKCYFGTGPSSKNGAAGRSPSTAFDCSFFPVHPLFFLPSPGQGHRLGGFS